MISGQGILQVFWRTVVYIALVFAIQTLNVFLLFFIYGSGQRASEIADIGYVNFLFIYLPLILVGVLLLYRMYRAKRRGKTNQFKWNGITLLIVSILYIFREPILTYIYLSP